VFILYSKHDDPNNYVIDLSNLLITFGYDCEIDQYHSGDRNIYLLSAWQQWIEKTRKVSEQNGFILCFCSPTLHQVCCSMSSSWVEMKCRHINNQNACWKTWLWMNQSCSHVIPVLLEHYDKECIPTCLLRTSTDTLNISEVLNVFKPDVMESIDNVDVISLLNSPCLESFRRLLFRLNNRQEVIKPSKSVDIACKWFNWLYFEDPTNLVVVILLKFSACHCANLILATFYERG